MASATAASRGRGWLTWIRILVEGLALGGVQLLLMYTLGWFTTGWISPSSLTLMGFLSACSYLVVSLAEGYLASSRTGKIRSGIPAAWLISYVSIFPVALPAIVLAGIVLFAPHAPCENCGLRGLAAVGLVLLVLLMGLWAWLVSTVGGWIGGIVAKLYQL